MIWQLTLMVVLDVANGAAPFTFFRLILVALSLNALWNLWGVVIRVHTDNMEGNLFGAAQLLAGCVVPLNEYCLCFFRLNFMANRQ